MTKKKRPSHWSTIDSPEDELGCSLVAMTVDEQKTLQHEFGIAIGRLLRKMAIISMHDPNSVISLFAAAHNAIIEWEKQPDSVKRREVAP